MWREASWIHETREAGKIWSNSAWEFFKGMAFCTGKEGLELYHKIIEQFGLYVSTLFKNGSDVMKRLLLLFNIWTQGRRTGTPNVHFVKVAII